MSQVASWDEFYQTRHLRRKPLVVAHRGASNVLPENTLASFALRLEQGADVLETDLRFTKDGEIVLFHDATLERMTEGAARCAIIRWQRSRATHLGASDD